jgi:hypothetical protein
VGVTDAAVTSPGVTLRVSFFKFAWRYVPPIAVSEPSDDNSSSDSEDSGKHSADETIDMIDADDIQPGKLHI